MNIVVSAHTILRAQERGASYDEIVSTKDNWINIAAKNNRLAKSKVFNFDSYRKVNTISIKNWKCTTLLKRVILLL